MVKHKFSNKLGGKGGKAVGNKGNGGLGDGSGGGNGAAGPGGVQDGKQIQKGRK